MNEKINSLLLKLKAMAERGEQGERQNAEKILADLMEKYNISFDDIESDKLEETAFRYKNDTKQILVQIIVMVCGRIEIYGTKGNTNLYFVKVTKAQKLEIEAAYDFFHKQYMKDLKVFQHAFIIKNELFSKDGSNSDWQPTEEELKRAAAARKLSQGLNKHELRKQLQENF